MGRFKQLEQVGHIRSHRIFFLRQASQLKCISMGGSMGVFSTRFTLLDGCGACSVKVKSEPVFKTGLVNFHSSSSRFVLVAYERLDEEGLVRIVDNEYEAVI